VTYDPDIDGEEMEEEEHAGMTKTDRDVDSLHMEKAGIDPSTIARPAQLRTFTAPPPPVPGVGGVLSSASVAYSVPG
jgi:hypothetical protein